MSVGQTKLPAMPHSGIIRCKDNCSPDNPLAPKLLAGSSHDRKGAQLSCQANTGSGTTPTC